MGAITIHLDDASRRRRRSKGPIVVALFGGVLVGSLLARTPPAPARVVQVPVVVTQTVAVPVPAPAPPVQVAQTTAPPVTQTTAPPVTQTAAPPPQTAATSPGRRPTRTTPGPRTTPAHQAPPPVVVATATTATTAPPPVRTALPPIGPVVDPPDIKFTAAGSRQVAITNPHDRSITIYRIYLGAGTTAGYEIDASDCNGRRLPARGGRCIVTISASQEAVLAGTGFRLMLSHNGREPGGAR